MVDPYATLPASPYVQGYSPWAPAGAPAPMWEPGAATSYQGLLDQLHLAGQSQAPTPGPVLPMPVVPPVALPSVNPSFQPLPILAGLLQQLGDLVDRFLSGPPTPAPPTVPTVPTAPPSTPSTPSTPARKATEFVISSFNVLGSSHTVPGASERPGMAPGVERIRSAANLLDRHDVDVVGFQEFQGDQMREFMKVAGDKFAVYPGFALGRKEVVNSIAWRKDTWELVKPGSIDIPYFGGTQRKMPVVRLRNRKTGQEAYFANFHNPASTRKHPGQERWRDIATNKQIELVNRLRQQTGLPVFITGDMNEREEYYNRITDGAGMVAANEGPNGRPPKQMGIDWIFGSPDVTFSDFTRDRGALVKKTSDHPMIVSKARIRGQSR